MIEGDIIEFDLDGLRHEAEIINIGEYTKEKKILEISIKRSWDTED